ncbi:MAG: hypothetical protein IJB11_08090 [Oscillospiraceae bacterium]|nr:hypothetical protein [Oscillospiraceae bacterium]
MTTFNPELIEKARAAKTAQELQALAKENGWEMTEESAQAYFEQLNKSGELSDEELSNVSGGGCYSGDRLVVTNFHCCDLWACEKCGSSHWSWKKVLDSGEDKVHSCSGADWGVSCRSCKYMIYNGLQLCNHPAKRK